MKTRAKIWLGVGAFALAQVAGVSMSGGVPNIGIGQPAQAADGTCGWERSSNTGRWEYDNNCERGERYVSQRGYYNNERGERWNSHNNGYHRGWDRGERWERGGDHWRHGERGERWGERG